jgi:hypothetical protein
MPFQFTGELRVGSKISENSIASPSSPNGGKTIDKHDLKTSASIGNRRGSPYPNSATSGIGNVIWEFLSSDMNPTVSPITDIARTRKHTASLLKLNSQSSNAESATHPRKISSTSVRPVLTFNLTPRFTRATTKRLRRISALRQSITAEVCDHGG